MRAKINNMLTDKELKEKVLSFDIFDKFKVWSHYMITNKTLIHTLGFCYEINELKGSKIKNKYPILGLKDIEFENPHFYPIKSFEDFCNEKDSRIPSSLVGWYLRKHEEIKI